MVFELAGTARGVGDSDGDGDGGGDGDGDGAEAGKGEGDGDDTGEEGSTPCGLFPKMVKLPPRKMLSF
jgi:hypothetical protein